MPADPVDPYAARGQAAALDSVPVEVGTQRLTVVVEIAYGIS